LKAESATAASGLDILIHGDPLEEPETPRPLIDAQTRIDPVRGNPSLRSESRAEQSRHRVPTGVVEIDQPYVGHIPLPPRADDQLRETSALPPAPIRGDGVDGGDPRLIQYVEGDLIRSPSQLSLDELPALIFDPKARLFHIDCDLSALAVYWRQSLPRPKLKSISSSDLARARQTMPGRNYDELRWLDLLLAASGRLNSKLDPGGSFCVREPIAIEPAFRAHGRIVAAMSSPARVHEVAAASAAPMEQVFDVINAYELIGRLHWTPRQSRFAGGEKESKPASGPLSRLKWPFGKR
jgi:hypothetical protein